MCNLNSCDVNAMLKRSDSYPDFVIDGVHFGRGDEYSNESTLTQFKHRTTKLKRWKIVNDNLEEIIGKPNNFYDSETYIIQWNVITENYQFGTNQVLDKNENHIYFYWKGANAIKGTSPLPESIEKDNPSVERIVQWAEPPAFLSLFEGSFIVHQGNHNNQNNEPKLYILRGELAKEIHLYQVDLKRENLRSRTSFVVFLPEETSSIVWHGAKSNSVCRSAIKTATLKHFGPNFQEIIESEETQKFLQLLSEDGNNGHFKKSSNVMDHTPRLFYLNQIGGNFNSIEIECCHKSDYITPFPFLQSHLYSADQPATFLLDDNDEIWLWQSGQNDYDNDFNSKCFTTVRNYAKAKSNLIRSLVKVQKVVAGFEPIVFANLFPVWNKAEDIITQLQNKESVPVSNNYIFEVGPDEDVPESSSNKHFILNNMGQIHDTR